MTDQTATTVHSLTSQTSRELAAARGLLADLEAVGVKPSKRLTTARTAAEDVNRLRAELRREVGTTEAAITDAAAAADRAELLGALARRHTLADALDALADDAVAVRLAQAEVSAVHGMANDARPTIADTFNKTAAAWLELYRDTFGGGVISAASVLGTPAAGKWSELLELAASMNNAARALDTVDGVDGQPEPTRYGRNLAHPNAGDRTYRGPAGPSYIRPSVDNADPYRDQPGREWRSGWEWLAAPELAPMVPWLLIATADARPGTVTRIEYAPEAQAAEDAEHARLWSDWTTTGGGGHQNVTTFAAQWWAERDAR